MPLKPFFLRLLEAMHLWHPISPDRICWISIYPIQPLRNAADLMHGTHFTVG